MSFSRAKTQPPPRAEDLSYEETGPGLYPGEVVVRLGTGHLVAVSCASRWLPNGEGVVFTAWARWVAGDGGTRRGPEGQELEIKFHNNMAVGMVAALAARLGQAVPTTIKTLEREHMLLVLGEDLTEAPVQVDEGEDPVSAPLVPWTTDVRLQASIAHTIAVVPSTGPEGLVDAADRLGI